MSIWKVRSQCTVSQGGNYSPMRVSEVRTLNPEEGRGALVGVVRQG